MPFAAAGAGEARATGAGETRAAGAGETRVGAPGATPFEAIVIVLIKMWKDRSNSLERKVRSKNQRIILSQLRLRVGGVAIALEKGDSLSWDSIYVIAMGAYN